jgi:hypothetical protein
MLTFDEPTHTYRWFDRVVPSVTTVIRAVGLSGFLPSDTWYLERGKAFHLATQMYDEGELDADSIDPAIADHLDHYRQFRATVGERLQIVKIEEAGYDSVWDFAGTRDRDILWDGRPAILELKTGTASKWHRLQTAAYAGLAGVGVRLCAYFTERGWKLDTHDDLDDWNTFTAAVAVYRWHERNGTLPANGQKGRT